MPRIAEKEPPPGLRQLPAILAGLLVICLVVPVRASDPPLEVKSDSQAPDFVEFQPPRPVGGIDSDSEIEQQIFREGKEGWVQLEMMVDTKGKAYEVAVVDSSGGHAFEESAVRVAERLVFKPAMSGTTPVDGNFTGKIAFHNDQVASRASPQFVVAYKGLLKALDAANKALADQALAEMRVKNLYEDAFAGYGKYLYDCNWGTEVEQRADLRRAVANEALARYLPDRVFRAALAAQLILDVQFNDYGGALETWETLAKIAHPMPPELQKTLDRVKAIQSGDQPVHMSAQIEKGTSWHGRLFRDRFGVSVSNGSVDQIKLRCKQKFVVFNFEPGVQYTITSKPGTCYIEVVGQTGTTFELTQ